MRLLTMLSFLFFAAKSFAQHPIAFATKSELAEVKAAIPKYALLQKSFNEIKADVDSWLGKEVDVPFPKDPAGGYTHDRHKANYTLMFNSGLLYNLTGDIRYATLVKNIFLKYAALNPTLKNHPQATSSSPGRIFWQALNDANWLVYAGMAYDLIYNSLSTSERKTIEDGAFKPEVDFVTKDLKTWFNLIHNHGVWACAGVGIVGIATGNRDYVDMALYGTDKKGKTAGFIAQLDGLFSPDGYYTEGPYYVRYAILPYYIFANALSKAKPELKIFQHRDAILKKALHAALQQTNINGVFLPINDALKEKDYTSNELVTAISIAVQAYGADEGLFTVANKQGRVLLNKGGISIVKAIVSEKPLPRYYPYKSVEYVDGAKGNEGGVSILRLGKGDDLTTLAFKYASHGLSHGHYDQLGFFMFDKGNEIFQDYGSVRFIGVEQKYGGRYLPENKTYASATIAHSTIVADEKNHFDGKEEVAEKHHGEKFFSNINTPNVQVVSAKENNAYSDVDLHRTLYMLQLPTGKKLVIDLFHAISPTQHQYDLPFQYSGQLINTSFKYKGETKTQKALSDKNGYQFLWKEAEAELKDTITQFTFLNGRTYYTLSSLIEGDAKIFFARSGANDPNFNLRREPSYIIRKNGTNQTFVNVIEIHGKFDPIAEFSTNSYPLVQNLRLIHNDENYTIAEVMVGKDALMILQSNKEAGKEIKHNISAGGKQYQWTGPFNVLFNNKTL
jgi:hypothetical protein